MTTYTPSYIARRVRLTGDKPRATTSCHIDTDDPSVAYVASFTEWGSTVSRHDGPVVRFLDAGWLHGELVALAERAVRNHFDGLTL